MLICIRAAKKLRVSGFAIRNWAHKPVLWKQTIVVFVTQQHTFVLFTIDLPLMYHFDGYCNSACKDALYLARRCQLWKTILSMQKTMCLIHGTRLGSCLPLPWQMCHVPSTAYTTDIPMLLSVHYSCVSNLWQRRLSRPPAHTLCINATHCQYHAWFLASTTTDLLVPYDAAQTPPVLPNERSELPPN